MPRIDEYTNYRPLRARLLSEGDRVTVEPAAEDYPPPVEYWRGWLDGMAENGRLTAVLAVISAPAGLITGAWLRAIFH